MRRRNVINEIGIVWHMNASGILLLPRSGLVGCVPPTFCDMTATVRQKARLPVWVKRVILSMRRSLPVLPEKQTFSELVGMSQRCQTLTSQPNQVLDLKWNTNGRRPKGGRTASLRC
jgi:hypothetical protein